jgi:hypothetical protein
MQKIRVAFRSFLKSPGFVMTVILTIALGIGANTAIFTLVHAVLLKSLPVVDPKSLYRIGDKDDCCVWGGFQHDDGDFDIFSYELYKHFRDNTPEFEQRRPCNPEAVPWLCGEAQSLLSHSAASMSPAITFLSSESAPLPGDR